MIISWLEWESARAFVAAWQGKTITVYDVCIHIVGEAEQRIDDFCPLRSRGSKPTVYIGFLVCF